MLQAGKNLITATVWNWGVFAPVAQMSDRTAFLLESEATGDAGISTPEGWQVEIEPGHRALDRSSVDLKAYFASGPGEEIDAAHVRLGLAIGAGRRAATGLMLLRRCGTAFMRGVHKAHSADTTGDNFWGLVPDALPHMEYAADRAWEKWCAWMC